MVEQTGARPAESQGTKRRLTLRTCYVLLIPLFFDPPHGMRLRWILDGADLVPATDLFTWEPRAGRHTLLLVDDAQHPHDTMTFEVRGAVAHAWN